MLPGLRHGVLILPFVAAIGSAPQLGPQGRSLDPTDVARLAELYRLTDELGAALWPGFDARTIPIAVNHDDRQELLVGHPRPPAAFKPVEHFRLGGQPVLVMEGRTRYAPRGGGGVVDIAGERTAYVSTIQPGQTAEAYLAVLLHESFHVYLRRTREWPDGKREQPPELSPTYAALLALESHILHAALEQPDEIQARHLGRMFVAVRRDRRKTLSDEVLRSEADSEVSEGTATYIESRLYELLAKTGGVQPTTPDPLYAGFRNAGELFRANIANILPREGDLVTFFHGMYRNGMAQALLLDRLRPQWKIEMRQSESTQFTILERELRADIETDPTMVAEAKRRFGFGQLLAEQTTLVNERVATIKGYLEGPGRRYRLYYAVVPGEFDWAPRGPVYSVPPELVAAAEKAVAAASGANTISSRRIGATIWAEGIRHLDVGDLHFESRDVPIIFREDYLEWIDREPAKDGSDWTIQSDREENGVHIRLRVTTRGFTLTVPRARIERATDLVVIRPVPASARAEKSPPGEYRGPHRPSK